MFPSRPPEPLGPGIAPVTIYEESIEEPQFIINSIKMLHKQRIAERLLNPRRKLVAKKKCGGRRVLRRTASVDAMDLDHDDTAMHRAFFPRAVFPRAVLPRAVQYLSKLPFFPAVASIAPRTPTARRPIPEDDEDEDEELIATDFDQQYHLTLEKAQQMQL
jgi:hypothetical protein